MATFTVNTHHAYLNHDIVIKAEGQITIEDTITGQKYEFQNELKTHLSAGRHILKSDGHEEEIIIEDALKLGGGKIKKAFVYETNPWVFIVTYDRLYAANIESKEEKVEYNVTPDEIQTLGNNSEYFLFQKEKDYSVYNVKTGTHVLFFSNYICSNSHLVIFKKDNTSVVVYDFLKKEIIDEFDGQYSVGHYFYYIKDEKLFGINLWSSYNTIEEITQVGRLNDDVLLVKDYLLKNYYSKRYYLYSLRSRKQIVKVELSFPCYIDSLLGQRTKHYSRVIDSFVNFKEKENELLSKYNDLDLNSIGVNITSIDEKGDNREIEIYGEYSFYPSKMMKQITFVLKGECNSSLKFSDAIIGTFTKKDDSRSVVENKIELAPGEKLLCKSQYGKLVLKQTNDKIILCNGYSNETISLFDDIFDATSYSSAYFTSDGQSIVLQISKTEGQLLGITDLSSTYFEVDGFTVAKNEGFNGYKPEITFLSGRRPVWRDPITLKRISEADMSSHVFKSPDGKYTASIQMKTAWYNRLSKSEVSIEEIKELKKKYNWDSDTEENEKKAIIELRKQLVTQCDRNVLFGKIVEQWKKFYSRENVHKRLDEKNNNNIEEDIKTTIEEDIERYINKNSDFVSLIIDKLGYVCYQKNEEGAEEKQILIGRSVYFLNYVAFSYDSKYLSFAAKMDHDDFRHTMEGVCEIYNIEKDEIVHRIENVGNHQLWAVWMTIFSKTGDVAFYDSCANAYLVHKSDNYLKIEEASGKSLLCFSPSGRYIACSDQNYIDYAHHPGANWGHQPSGNVFVHSVNNFCECLEQYNDMGNGISGVATRAGNISSAAFSQDETKLLMVGNDGVVVVRNLKKTKQEKFIFDNNYNDNKDDYATHYGEYAGSYAQDVMGYSDDVINDAFDGDPDAYWNID